MSAPARPLLWVGDLLRLGRPLHLVGGALFYGIGLALAAAARPLQGDTATLGLLALLATQLFTHYSNDYYDLDADRENRSYTRWSGGSRVLADGRLPPQAALIAALVCGAMALGAGAWAAALSPVPAGSLTLLGLGMLLAWAYSAPPLALNRRGLGELTGALLVPGLSIGYASYLQVGGVGRPALLAAAPLCLLQFAMLIAVNLPDAAGDARVGKRTLVVLLGSGRAAILYMAAVLAAFALLPLLALGGLGWPVALAGLIAAPIACGLAVALARGAWARPAAWESLSFWSIGQLMAVGLGELVALLI